eukprot:6398280-Alexandrium_andersonii.AAC.1
MGRADAAYKAVEGSNGDPPRVVDGTSAYVINKLVGMSLKKRHGSSQDVGSEGLHIGPEL